MRPKIFGLTFEEACDHVQALDDRGETSIKYAQEGVRVNLHIMWGDGLFIVYDLDGPQFVIGDGKVIERSE